MNSATGSTMYTAFEYALSFLTLFGAWGGFPVPPKFFTWLTANVPFLRYFFQWLMLFVLVYQGGSGQKALLAAVTSSVFFIVFEIVKGIENRFWPGEVEA